MYRNKIPQHLDYGVTVTLKVMGGKWKPCIIDCVATGIQRPTDIQKAIKHTSLRVINKQLSELVEYEVLTKEVYEGYPLKVAYHLTAFGATLLPIIAAMEHWGDQYAEKVAQLAVNRNESIQMD